MGQPKQLPVIVKNKNHNFSLPIINNFQFTTQLLVILYTTLLNEYNVRIQSLTYSPLNSVPISTRAGPHPFYRL